MPVRPIGRSVPKKTAPTIKEQSESPEISDSDPEENYQNYSNQQLNIDRSLRKKRKNSGSESSMASSLSEEGSIQSHSVKRPVATPRRHKSAKETSRPPLPPKPREEKDTTPRPPLPPRPTDMPKIRKHKSLEEVQHHQQQTSSNPNLLEPARPLRPRMSEIKRAKDRARAASKNTPALMVVDEDNMSDISSRTTKTCVSYTSSKSAPPLQGKDVQQKRRTHTVSAETETPQLMVPNSPQKQRRRSSNDEPYNRPSNAPVAPTVGSLDETMLGGGLNSAAMANTLLKMIISSEDQGLKDKLRELITQDTDIASSL